MKREERKQKWLREFESKMRNSTHDECRELIMQLTEEEMQYIWEIYGKDVIRKARMFLDERRRFRLYRNVNWN